MLSFKKTFFLIILFTLLLAACSQGEAEQVLVTVEVTREVTREVVIERVVVEQQEGDEDDATNAPQAEATATPAAEHTTTQNDEPRPTPEPTPFESGQVGDFTAEDLELLHEVWSLIEENYYGDLPTDEAVRDAIIDAAITTLGDRHTNYLTAVESEEMTERFQRLDFEGIGAYVDTNDLGQFIILRPIPDTPASKAGLKPNDIVLLVDGEEVTGQSTDQVVSKVRGPAGEAVVLTILREGVSEPFDVAIIRAHIDYEIPVVVSEMYEGDIGYIYFSTFLSDDGPNQLQTALQQLLDDGAKGIVFDLRFNGGGYLTQALFVSDLFLDDGKTLVVRDSAGNEEVFRSETGQIGEEIPLVVLVNEGSASASEIVSAAIQDRERGTIIGHLSFGKGSVQSLYNLSDGSEIRITTARFYSPDDHVINGVGITPDIIVNDVPTIIGDENDLQLQRAIQFLQGQ